MKIGELAFSLSGLVSIDIPSNVHTIGKLAFNSCESLKEVHFLNEGGRISSMTKIEERCFLGCKTLRKVTLPSNLVRIEQYAFADCQDLHTIDIPDSVNNIGQNAFQDCTNLICIKLPPTLSRIEQGMFENCGFHSFVIPDSIRTIARCAFLHCLKLQFLYLPKSVENIGNCAFAECVSLRIVTMPQQIQLDNQLLYRCAQLFESKESREEASAYKYYHDYKEYDESEFLWLQKRFDALPIHNCCFDPNVTDEKLSLLLQSEEISSFDSKDVLGMSPLHILCANPNATAKSIKRLIEADPNATIIPSEDQIYPLDLYLRRTLTYDSSLNDFKREKHHTRLFKKVLIGRIPDDIRFVDLFKFRLNVEMFEVICCFRSSHLLTTTDTYLGLFPFMMAACSSKCKLEIVYLLAMKVPYVLGNETLYKQFENLNNEVC